ncbi:unnamed protein product [Notodromas monacha]|uniref:Uncharacterized protein n=1 Tax=Notodromas monacha TaxID=399045 RepID=A0A7R9G9Z2_9CRUS|nr:unnamed protein product [Notodromas monacha]CAG0913457.1 unnamed protein product [Notodromas monacha]
MGKSQDRAQEKKGNAVSACRLPATLGQRLIGEMPWKKVEEPSSTVDEERLKLVALWRIDELLMLVYCTHDTSLARIMPEVSWDVTEVSAKRDSVEEIRSSVPKKQLKISTVLSGSKADSRSRQISSTKPAIAKDSSVTQSASSVIKAKVMKLKKLSSSSNDPSSPGGDKPAWVVRKVDVVATPVPTKEEHVENSADRRPAESRQSSFLEDLRFQLKSAHNKKREVHSPQEFFGSPDMRHLTVLGDSLKPQPTEPEKARNISTREIKDVSDKLTKVRSKPRLVLGAKKDPRKMTPIDVEEVSKSPLSSQSRGKRAIERRVEFEAVLDAELSRVSLENCPNEGNDALDHDYLDKPANTWKAWSMENPAYQNPRDFVIKRFKSQYRVIEVDGFEFEEYMWYMYDPYVRLTRCSHYKVAGVECKVKGAINLKENKFFYEAIFSAANHNHTASEAPPKIKNVIHKRLGISSLRSEIIPLDLPPPRHCFVSPSNLPPLRNSLPWSGSSGCLRIHCAASRCESSGIDVDFVEGIGFGV